MYLPGLLYVAFVGAIISAILSAVHSALHAPAAQISHNIVVRLVPGLSDRGKLWSVRLTVLALSIVAFVISLSSEGIKELVETASAFGSAGVFVATLFALFTRFGGPLSAYASVAAGMLVWAGGKYVLGSRRALSARPAGGARRLRRRRCCSRTADESSVNQVSAAAAEHCLRTHGRCPARLRPCVSDHRHATVVRQCQPRRVFCAANAGLAATRACEAPSIGTTDRCAR